MALDWNLIDEYYQISMDRSKPFNERIQSARLVIPYLYKRMPQSTEIEIKGNKDIVDSLQEIYGYKPTDTQPDQG